MVIEKWNQSFLAKQIERNFKGRSIKAGTNTRDSGLIPGPKFASIKIVFKMQMST